MRVSYTLPGFLPAEASSTENIRGGDSPFRPLLPSAPAPRWADWKSLLRLDQPAASAATMGPPPRPASFDVSDAASQRWMWRQMLDRQVAAFEAQSSGANQLSGSSRPNGQQVNSSVAGQAGSGSRAIQRMLALLVQMREAEDELAGMHLAGPEN
jgi:hypothetical protein